MKEKTTPISMLRKESEASQLLRADTVTSGRLITMVEVKPNEQPHISLGNYRADKPPRGFALEVTPEEMRDAVVPQITRLSAEYDEFELVLHIANYGDQTVNVEVSQL